MYHSQETRSRTILALLGLGYLAFVVYGSLVPLDYRPLPLNEALWRFQSIRFLDLGIGSRADWVANILLFIPLSFLWLGVLWPPQGSFGRILAALLILTIAISLSIAIEFTQLYFPPRTVSQNDILAETLGACIGILLWWRFGSKFWRWVTQALNARGKTHLAEKLLWLYLAGLFLYSVLPLDLTISPVEIYHKWQSGKVNLIPFGFFVADPVQQLYDLGTDVLIWIPVSLLWVVSGKRTGMQAWAWAVLAALSLEFMQFFVYSRVSDTTDILMAMIGAAIGIWLAGFIGSTATHPDSRPSGITRPIWAIIISLVWMMMLLAIFWYPFDFQFDRAFLRERIGLLDRVPFHAYYYGTEFRAVTELLHKILFFMPLGGILAFGRAGVRRASARTLYTLFSIAILLAVPIGIELGQIALPEKSPSTTDMLLEMLGGCLGYFGLLWMAGRSQKASDSGRKTAL